MRPPHRAPSPPPTTTTSCARLVRLLASPHHDDLIRPPHRAPGRPALWQLHVPASSRSASAIQSAQLPSELFTRPTHHYLSPASPDPHPDQPHHDHRRQYTPGILGS